MTYMCVLMEQEWFVTNWQNITTLQQLWQKFYQLTTLLRRSTQLITYLKLRRKSFFLWIFYQYLFSQCLTQVIKSTKGQLITTTRIRFKNAFSSLEQQTKLKHALQHLSKSLFTSVSESLFWFHSLMTRSQSNIYLFPPQKNKMLLE